MELNGKRALVLGAVKGIGRGIAIALKSRGVNVAATHWDWEEELPQLKAQLEAIEGKHHLVRTNLLDTDTIPGMVQEAVDRLGGLDILVNNIERGGWPVVHGPYAKDQWDLEMATTLRAKQWVFSSALSHLKASGNGAVVNLSSIAAIVGRSGPASLIFNEGYAAASRGCALLTETWARLGAPQVRVNELMIGIMATRHGPGTRGWGLLEESDHRSIIDHTLLERTGTVEDVVSAVLFLIRDAVYMTGSVVRLDGGYVLGSDRTADMPPGVDPPTRIDASGI